MAHKLKTFLFSELPNCSPMQMQRLNAQPCNTFLNCFNLYSNALTECLLSSQDLRVCITISNFIFLFIFKLSKTEFTYVNW